MEMIGHNQPRYRDSAVAEMKELLAPFEERRDQFIAAAKRQVVRNRQEAADAADIIKLSNAVWVMIHEKRLSVSNPHREAHEAVIHHTGTFWQDCENAMKELQRRINAFTSVETKRIAAQKAEQDAEDARLREANSPAAASTVAPVRELAAPRAAPIVGDYGGRVTVREEPEYLVDDVQLVPLDILKSPRVTAAIIAVAKDFAKHMPAISGIRIVLHQVGKAR